MSSLYIGRECDSRSLAPTPTQALIDTRKLVRHGVLLGMTGSGKTGLGVCLLEEVAMAGVPIIAIDPKGDLTNLALSFPALRPGDFEPWVDPAEARRKQVDVPTRAAQLASSWERGHADWGIDSAARQRFAASPVTVYTPGSSAGVPVNVLASLGAPDKATRDDPETLTELATGTVAALLRLAGVEADSFRDPESIVLTQIIVDGWQSGRDLSVETILTLLIDPPFDKVGVFPVDTFFPRKDRLDLAMKLNAVIASPAFSPWSQGVALDPVSLLSTSGGPAPIHVFSIAHLDAAMREFFLGMLLNSVVAWSRRQPGTGDLRALLYIDEVFGMLPPYPANPPAKQPILTLMKQARAVGVGVVLATQNPVDLDYKALSNAGTWFVGRLQTEQDRERVIEGLAGAGGMLDRNAVDQWLQQLPARTFVHRDVEEPAPRLLHARWAISYLRGPLTRQEIERLPKPAAAGAGALPSVDTAAGVAAADAAEDGAPSGYTEHPPPAPEGTRYQYLAPGAGHKLAAALAESDLDLPAVANGKRLWIPGALAKVDLRFDEGTSFATELSIQRLVLPLGNAVENAMAVELSSRDLLDQAPAGWYAPLPPDLDEASELRAFEKALVDKLYRSEKIPLYRQRTLKLTSEPDESESSFRARVNTAISERIDEEIAALRARVEKAIDRLNDRIERKQLDIAQAESSVSAQRTQEVVNVGETLLGLLLGGRRKSLSSTVTRRRQTMRAQARVTALQTELRQLEEEVLDEHDALSREIADITESNQRLVDDIETIEVGLERNDIRVRDFSVLWVCLDDPGVTT